MSFNATLAGPNVLETLYPGTDLASLNWAEQKWVAWYVWWGNPVIATGMISFLMHEVFLLFFLANISFSYRVLRPQIVYFGRSIPWIIFDALPYFRKWKLQPNKVPTAKEQWECTKLVLWAHFTVELPTVSTRTLYKRPILIHFVMVDLALPPHG